MRFETLIETVSEIATNEKIEKDGLILVYKLDPKAHKQMDEHLYFQAHPTEPRPPFKHQNVVECDIAGITVVFTMDYDTLKKEVENNAQSEPI